MVRIRRQLEKSGTERMETTTDSIKQRLQRSRVIMEDSLSVATGQLLSNFPGNDDTWTK
jgi:hypothetical protein